MSHGHHHATSSPRESLARGAGRGQFLFFDAFSGVAGDMTIAALLDLGVPSEAIEEAVHPLGLNGYALDVGHATKSGIVGTKFDVKVTGRQGHRTYRSIDDLLVKAELPAAVRETARAIFRRLGESEAAMHRMPLDEVHFHEVGAVDAIVDIVGAAAALAYLEPARIVATPLPMGRGFVKAQHGILPLPAPATVHCLRDIPTYGVDLDAELVTPTGAAIIATVADHFSRWPDFTPTAVGFGAGTKDFADRPNLLRVILGRGGERPVEGRHIVIEANVDDLTGELAGHALSALQRAGALDAWAVPVMGKKGRPALLLSAITTPERQTQVSDALLRETTTIGLRRYPVNRVERPRRTETVETAFGLIDIKISEGLPGPATAKPEFDQCAARASEHGVSVREVLLAAERAFQGSSAEK